MRNKKVVITIIALIIPFVLIMKFIGYHEKEGKGIIGFFGRLLNPTNDFEFITHNVDEKDIDIIWNSEDNSDTLVKDGTLINNFGYDYGPNRFTVIYKNELEYTSSFFSENNNETYNVKIEIIKEADTIYAVYNFDGDKKEVALQ